MIVTQNEVEALHLEQNLVKRHRPPFNVRLRDDKSFPYIAVTAEDEYPRVMFTRERHRRGVVYFGPYANAKKVRETLDVLNRVFPYRPCEGPKPGRHSGIPCLDYHIDRCLAPCVGYVSKDDYRAIIDQVIEFLSGNTRADPARARAEDAGSGRGRAVRGGRALSQPAAERATSGRTAGRRSPLRRNDRRDRARGRGRSGRCAGLPASRREDDRPLLLPPRKRRRAGPRNGARVVLPGVLRLRSERPAADRRAPCVGGYLGARGLPFGAARGSGRSSRGRARGEAPATGARNRKRAPCTRLGGPPDGVEAAAAGGGTRRAS